jgi:hypothetical protein
VIQLVVELEQHGTLHHLALPDINSKNMSWVDEPATTSATTYKISISVPNSSSYNVYVNRAANDTDAQYQSRVASSITVMEISA